MDIRPANPTDPPHLADLWQERAVLLRQADARTARHLPAREEWLARLDERMAAATAAVFVIEETGQPPFGYIIAEIERQQPAGPSLGIIREMALDAHSYHGGAGRALVAQARDWLAAQSVDRIVALVPRYHAVEQAFWRGLGASEWKDKTWTIPPEFMWMTW
ncbi:MAG: N-acetyltransferase family protein [Phototrophicaceae bacterium]